MGKSLSGLSIHFICVLIFIQIDPNLHIAS